MSASDSNNDHRLLHEHIHRYLTVEFNVALVFDYLDVRELDSCACVSKLFNKVVTQELQLTWRSLYLRSFHDSSKILKEVETDQSQSASSLPNHHSSSSSSSSSTSTSSTSTSSSSCLSKKFPYNFNYRSKARQLCYFIHSNRPFQTEEIRPASNKCVAGLHRRSGFVSGIFSLNDLDGKTREIIFQFGGATDEYRYTNDIDAFECVALPESTSADLSSERSSSFRPPQLKLLRCRKSGTIPSSRWLHCGVMTEGNKMYISGGQANHHVATVKMELFMVTAEIVPIPKDISSSDLECQRRFGCKKQIWDQSPSKIAYISDDHSLLNLVSKHIFKLISIDPEAEGINIDVIDGECTAELADKLTVSLYCEANSLNEFVTSETFVDRINEALTKIFADEQNFEVVFTFSEVKMNKEILSRFGHVVVFDSLRNRMVLFGGRNEMLYTQYNEIFYMDVSDPSKPLSWIHQVTDPARQDPDSETVTVSSEFVAGLENVVKDGEGGHVFMNYERHTNRLSSRSSANHDYLEGTAKEAKEIVVPSPRYCPSAIVCGREMFLFGGWDRSTDEFFNDIFSLNLDTYVWKRVDVNGGVPPSPRCQSNMFLIDGCASSSSRGEGRRRGGGGSNGMQSIGGGSKAVTASSPPCFHDAIGSEGAGSRRGYLVVFGGAAQNAEQAALQGNLYGNIVIDYGDLHIFDLDTGVWLPQHPVTSSMCCLSRGGVNSVVSLNRDHERLFFIMGGMHSDPNAEMPVFKNEITILSPDWDIFR